MYEKIIVFGFALLVVANSEENSPVRNVKNVSYLNSRLPIILPYLSSYNSHFTKDNSKRLLYLLMRDKHEKLKEPNHKTKRCSTLRKDKFLSSSTKEDFSRVSIRNPDKNTNAGISKQNSNVHSLVKNAQYSQENSATSNRMKAEAHKDEFLEQAFMDNLSVEDVNSGSQVKAKKRNAEKCICYCKEENCFPKSSTKSSSRMVGSSKKGKSEKINHWRPEKYGNVRPDISQQKSLRLHERPYESRVSGPVNSFPVRSYQERVSNIPPHVPILYGIKPYILSQVVGDERKFVDVAIPFTSFQGRRNFLVGSNVHNQNQPIRSKLYPCPYITDESQIEDSVMSATSPPSYTDVTTVAETESDPNYDSIVITEKNEEILNNYISSSADSKTETNSHQDYSAAVTEKGFLDKMFHRLEDSTEATERNQDNELSKLAPSLTVGTSSASSIIYPSITHNENFINMDECIKLFGRDVCVLRTTSLDKLAEQAQKNNLNEHFTIRVPEYIMQTSTEKGATLNSINYSDKLETTDEYHSLKSSVSKIEKLNADSNNNLESASTESNANVANSIKQIHASDDDYENESPSIVESTRISIKKLGQTIPETTETARNKLLGKSKSFKTELLLNDKDTANPISDEKFRYSTTSQELNGDEDVNLEVDQQNWITTTNSWQNTLDEKKIAFINYDSKTRHNSKEESTNYSIESNINTYSKEKLKEESATDHEPKTEYNFEEETINDLLESRVNIDSKEKILQEQPKEITTVGYDSKIKYNFEKESKNDLIKLNANAYPKTAILQEEPVEVITSGPGLKTTYNFEEKTENNLIELKTNIYPEGETPREPLATKQYIDREKSSDLNNKENTTNSLEVITESPRRLPFCDNTLLLNSIRKVINDFASDTRLTKTKDFDENILQMQGKNLLPEILQVPYLKDILSMPRIENTIVEKVKDILSDITGISKKDFTNDWSHGVIRNTLQSILEGFSGKKLPPMTVEEHQFANGQWTTNPVTLLSNSDSKLSMTISENSHESINDYPNFLASHTDQQIIRNMIAQSVMNSPTCDDEEEIDDSIIHDVLNDVHQNSNNRTDDENVKVTTSKNFIQKTLPDYTNINEVIPKNTAEVKNVGDKMEYILNEETVTVSTDNSTSSTNANKNQESNVVASNAINPAIILERIQHNLPPIKYYSPEILKKIKNNRTGDEKVKVIAAPTNLMQEISSTESINNNDSRDKNDKDSDSNSSNDSNILIGNKINHIDNTIIEADEISTRSSNDIYSVQLFPSSTDSDNISELQKSQLYYINDGVKLPLEIRKLKDGSYALSISKNICEQIMKRKCCVPLQGHVVRTSRKIHHQVDGHIMTSTNTDRKEYNQDIYMNDNNREYQFSNQSPSIILTSVTTSKSTLTMQKQEEEEEEEERINAHRLWRRNLNNNDLTTISMPVIDFARKYNLLLNFNDDEMLFHDVELRDKIQNYNKLLIKSVKGYEYDQSEKKSLNGNSNMENSELLSENKSIVDEFQDLVNVREKKNILETNFPRFGISQEFSNLNMHKLKTKDDIQNVNVERKINSKKQNKNLVSQRINISEIEIQPKNDKTKWDKFAKDVDVFQKKKENQSTQRTDFENQERISIPQRIIISQEEIEVKSEEMNWDKLTDIPEENVKILHKKEKREHEETGFFKDRNISKIKVYEKYNEKPYRHQQNTNNVTNKKIEIVKSILHWFKGLFVDE